MNDDIDTTYSSVKCLKCGSHIQSKHRHDFHYCDCRRVAVDGGKDYLRVVGDIEHFEVVGGSDA